MRGRGADQGTRLPPSDEILGRGFLRPSRAARLVAGSVLLLHVHLIGEQTAALGPCLAWRPMRHTRAAELFATVSWSCGSSVVEHSLGKGEVESSILSRSTSN
jgi:hypothetical protein